MGGSKQTGSTATASSQETDPLPWGRSHTSTHCGGRIRRNSPRKSRKDLSPDLFQLGRRGREEEEARKGERAKFKMEHYYLTTGQNTPNREQPSAEYVKRKLPRARCESVRRITMTTERSSMDPWTGGITSPAL